MDAGTRSVTQDLHPTSTTGITFTRDATLTLGGACDSTRGDVRVSGPTDAIMESTTPCSADRWSYVTPTVSSDAVRVLSFDQDNSPSTLTWVHDTTAPTLANLRLAPATTSPVRTNHPAMTVDVDDRSPIGRVCASYVLAAGAAPDADARCWVLQPHDDTRLPGASRAIDLVGDIGRLAGRYRQRVWVEDLAGNRSSSTELDIDYLPTSPPDIVSISATNTLPSGPISAAQLSFGADDDVFIVWTIDDDDGVGTVSVDLEWRSVEESVWQSIASALPATTVMGCAAPGGASGCYRWRAPGESGFRVRIRARDADERVALREARAANTAPLSIIAGDTSDRLGGDAQSVVISLNESGSSPNLGNPSRAAVASDGKVYLLDRDRGLLMVDPERGTVELLVRQDPTLGATGDGGPADEATIARGLAMAISDGPDGERLYLQDLGAIRVVELSLAPPTIDTLIGGGTAPIGEPPEVERADEVYFAPSQTEQHQWKRNTIVALPNGDLIFRTEAYRGRAADSVFPGRGLRFRHYHASDGLVSSIFLSGRGVADNPSQDVTLCNQEGWGARFDPDTGTLRDFVVRYLVFPSSAAASSCRRAIDAFDTDVVRFALDGTRIESVPRYDPADQPFVGQDGELYGMSTDEYLVRAEGDMTVTLAGNGTRGSCPDGTLALECPLALESAFVGPGGEAYVVDAGRVRAIDADGRIVTLAGSSRNHGDGGASTNARFGELVALEHSNHAGGLSLQVLDADAYVVREVAPDGTVETLAGNGDDGPPTIGELGVREPLSMTESSVRVSVFVTDASTGDVYFRRDRGLARLSRASGRWEDFVGVGSTYFDVADAGTPPTEIRLEATSFFAQPWAIAPSSVLIVPQTRTQSDTDRYLRAHSLPGGSQIAVAGNGGGSSDWCTNGTSAAACALPVYIPPLAMRGVWTGSSWLVQGGNRDAARQLIEIGGSISRPVRATTESIRAFTRDDAGQVYYCGAQSERLFQYADGSRDLALPWADPELSCAGHSMLHDPISNALYFIGVRNGIYAIARYDLP